MAGPLALHGGDTEPSLAAMNIAGEDRTHLDTKRIALVEQAEKPS
jgi:hypothetical protein